jgi:hypothetical protein
VFLKFIDPVSPIENGVVCEYGKSSEAICYVLKDNNLFYLRHRPQNDESAKMTIADVLYASFNTSINEKAPEASGYITFVDLIKNAHGQLAGNKYGELQTTANRILKLEPDNEYGHLLSSIAESFNRKSYPSLKGFGEIGLLLRLYQAIKNDQYEKIDRDMRRDVFSYLDNPNNSSFLNDLRSCLLVQKNRIDLPDQEAETYLKSILEDGHFTGEIIKKLSSDQFLTALKIHLNKINSKISAIDKADKNLLYCFAKGDAPAWNDRSEANIFYDLTAFNKVYKRGNESAINELGKIFEQRGININLNQTLVAIVARGLIIYDYDALVFTKDRLVVVKDFRDDIENRDIYEPKYENLNPGNDSLEFENDKYNNKALLTLLKYLHAVTKKSGTGTKWNLLTYLKDQIRSLAIEEIMIPTPI